MKTSESPHVLTWQSAIRHVHGLVTASSSHSHRSPTVFEALQWSAPPTGGSQYTPLVTRQRGHSAFIPASHWEHDSGGVGDGGGGDGDGGGGDGDGGGGDGGGRAGGVQHSTTRKTS